MGVFYLAVFLNKSFGNMFSYHCRRLVSVVMRLQEAGVFLILLRLLKILVSSMFGVVSSLIVEQ